MGLEELRAKIEASINPYDFNSDGMDGYENCANFAAKTLLEVAKRDPVAFGKALDAFRNDPSSREIETLLTAEEISILLDGRYGLTGFQWGWAVNAVAHLLEQPGVPNPALITINKKDPGIIIGPRKP